MNVTDVPLGSGRYHFTFPLATETNRSPGAKVVWPASPGRGDKAVISAPTANTEARSNPTRFAVLPTCFTLLFLLSLLTRPPERGRGCENVKVLRTEC